MQGVSALLKLNDSGASKSASSSSKSNASGAAKSAHRSEHPYRSDRPRSSNGESFSSRNDQRARGDRRERSNSFGERSNTFGERTSERGSFGGRSGSSERSGFGRRPSVGGRGAGRSAPRTFGPNGVRGGDIEEARNESRSFERDERNSRSERTERSDFGLRGEQRSRGEHGSRGEHHARGERGDRGERGGFGGRSGGGRGGFRGASRDKQPQVETAGSKSRAAAAMIVEAVNQGVSMSEAVPRYCEPFDSRDTAFIKEIVYGTLRYRRVLMGTLKPMFDYKINERNRIIQALLITAMYQIVYMRVPAHAVVSATVSACGDVSRKSFSSTVNAILRRFLREGGKVIETEDEAVQYSFPDWLVERLKAGYDAQAVTRILQASNIKAPLFLRVENSKISTQDFIDHLAQKEIAATTSELCKSTVRLESAANVYDIPGFSEGLCTVQDISAQLAADFLKLDSDKAMQILDCCCAPGGKTAHILDLSPKSHVTALDIDEERLEQTVSTLKRLGRLNSVELKAMDATEIASLDKTFDRILVDAPCSGTGVIRRHPDIKWLRRDKDIASLCEIQARILDAAYDRLNKGGVLLYTTCSILPDENIRQVEAFMQRHPDAIQDKITLGDNEFITLQRLPGDDDGDGFFYARFIKPE